MNLEALTALYLGAEPYDVREGLYKVLINEDDPEDSGSWLDLDQVDPESSQHYFVIRRPTANEAGMIITKSELGDGKGWYIIQLKK